MKRIILILLALTFTSCEEFLSEDVRGVISPNNFYNSDQEAIQAANGLYLGLNTGDLYDNWQGISAYMYFGTDEVMPNRIFGGLAQIMNYDLTETNYGNAYGIWQDFYKVIGDANSVLANVKDNAKISKPTQDRVLGEAYFLRALAYYHLTSLWGGVPFYLDELSLAEVGSLGRTDVAEIRNQMIADLKTAEAILPAEYSAAETGHATKWAAKFLRTRYHLWQKDWPAALEASKDIINNSQHKLMTTYEAVFDVNNQFNDEAIFGIDFLNGVDGQTITDSFNPRLRDEPRNSAQRGAFAAALTARGEEFNGFGLAVPINDLIKKFPKDDLRRPLNIMDKYLGYDLTFSYFKKRTNFDFVQSPRGNHGEWWITMRLAQVYLMAAEAANEAGNAAEAYQYINRIRERAYSPAQPLTGLTQTTLRKAIQDEYKWELAGEGERRYDLIRWGILVETIKNTDFGIHEGDKNIQTHMVKLPIPAEEIVLNPKLLESDPTNNGYR